MATMYDGINSDAAIIARNFPGVPYVAGYVNGRFAWSQAQWALFPNSKHIQITITASADAGDVLDVEQGDASPDQCEGWIAMRKASGYFRPTIYCNLSTVPAVRAGTGKFILGKDYDLWVAVYDGTTSVPYNGAIAKQYASGQNWDSNVVYDVNWPYRTAPVPLPGNASAFTETPHEDHTGLSWNAAPGADSYDVQVVQGKTQVFRKSIPGTSIDVPTKAGLAYAWHVAPENSFGSSGWSPLRVFHTPAPPFPAPTGLRATTGIIGLSWDVVSPVAGVTPHGYTVTVLDSGKPVETLNVTGNSATVQGLTQGRAYEIEVVADGGQGTPGSASISVTA